MKKRYYIVMATLLLGVSVAKSQDHIKLDLQKTIQLANDSSLEAFRTQNMYLSGYWEYRTYKANRLPSLTLNMTPAEYNRDITKRYDSENDLDVYRSQQSFYASGNLAIQQNFDLTGGTFYLQSQLGYMRRLLRAMLYLPFLTPQSTNGMLTLTDTKSCCMGL